MRERVLYIDAIKAVLMFLVIWGHTIQYTNANEGLGNLIAAFIYSFHMPMFMMLSGMFFKRSLQLHLFVLLRKNFLRFILPALVITFSLFTIVYVNKPRGLYESLTWMWTCRPWFITTLFCCNVTTFIVYRVVKYIGYSFLITFILFCLLPSISDRLIFMYPYFVLGYYINYFTNNQRVIVSRGGGKIALALFAMCILFSQNTAEITIYITPYTFWGVEDGVHLDKSLFIALKRYFIALCGSIGMFYALKKILCGVGVRFCRLGIVQYIGKNTLGLYLLQTGLFTIYMGVRNETLSNLTYGRDWLACLLSFLILAVLLFCIKIIRKSKILKLLVLGESEK